MRHGLLGLLLLGATAAEAANYPQIDGSIISFNTADQATATVTLPDSIVAGNLLVIVYAMDGGPSSTTTWPAGWTVCSALTYDPDSAVGLEVRYRVADGTEGASIDVTLSPNNQFSAVALRITDYTGTPSCGPTPVTTATGTPTTGLDAPAHTAPWGAADNLWIAATANDDGRRSVLWPALTYTTTQNVLLFRALSNVSLGAAAQAVAFTSANATEDPGTTTINASDEWVANTLVIQGAAPVGGGGGGGGIIGG
jgi:hypothetical protein